MTARAAHDRLLRFRSVLRVSSLHLCCGVSVRSHGSLIALTRACTRPSRSRMHAFVWAAAA